MAKIYVKNSFHFCVREWRNGQKFFFNQIRSLKIASSLVTGCSPVTPKVDQGAHHIILHGRVHFGEGRQGGAGICKNGKIRKKKSENFDKPKCCHYLFHSNFLKNDPYHVPSWYHSTAWSNDIKLIVCFQKVNKLWPERQRNSFSWPACLFWL